MYGLRKVSKELKHYDFTWDLTIGVVNTAPDWNPKVECGNGLHLLPNAQGDYNLLTGHYWVIVEFDETKMVVIDKTKAKVESCTIVHVSENTDGLIKYFKDVTFNSRSAKGWARNIGNREHMMQFITDSRDAYWWALNIGDRDHMKPLITESQWACNWARNIGDREHMMQFVTDSGYAYWWARNIGDKEYMLQFNPIIADLI